MRRVISLGFSGHLYKKNKSFAEYKTLYRQISINGGEKWVFQHKIPPIQTSNVVLVGENQTDLSVLFIINEATINSVA